MVTDMSMLSTQVDELRELANRYDELQVGAVKAVTMPSDMGSILREAADTIWELRGSVHRERAEADRLREELDRMTEAVEALHSAPLEDQLVQALNEADRLREQGARLFDKTLELGTENAQLREERCEYQATIDSLVDECADHKAENAKLRELAAQMGEMLDCDICDRRVGCNWQDDGTC